MILEQNGLSRSHPNLLWLDEEKLGIEQVRKIKEFLSLKPYQGKSQAVVAIQADNLSLDAQNAFLKTLEEPPAEAVIILGVSSEDKLLPTVISRCQITHLDKDKRGEGKYFPDIEKLLGASTEERFKFIEKLDGKDQFLKDLAAYFQGQLLKEPEKHKDFIKDILEAEKWANQNVNIRAILEYLMLKMPILSH